MVKIQDGTGERYEARVDQNKALHTLSVSVPSIMRHSIADADAFTVHFHFKQGVAGTTEYVGYLTYTGDNILVLDRVIYCTEESAKTAFILSLDATGLGGGSTVTPINLNRTSANSISVTSAHQNDNAAAPVTLSTTGTHWFCSRLNGPGTLEFKFNEALVLGKNDNILISAKADTVNSLVRATLFYFEDMVENYD